VKIWFETRRGIIAISLKLCHRIWRQEGPSRSERIEIHCNTSPTGLCWKW